MFTKETLEKMLKEKENLKIQLEGLYQQTIGQTILLKDMLKKLEENSQPK